MHKIIKQLHHTLVCSQALILCTCRCTSNGAPVPVYTAISQTWIISALFNYCWISSSGARLKLHLDVPHGTVSNCSQLIWQCLIPSHSNSCCCRTGRSAIGHNDGGSVCLQQILSSSTLAFKSEWTRGKLKENIFKMRELKRVLLLKGSWM